MGHALMLLLLLKVLTGKPLLLKRRKGFLDEGKERKELKENDKIDINDKNGEVQRAKKKQFKEGQ